jgi:hypothetical protein
VTGYTVHTGASKKFSEGWDRVFARSAKAKKAADKPAKPASGKKRGGK